MIATDWAPTFRKVTRLRVTQAGTGEVLAKGSAYLAPADHHLIFRKGRAHLDLGAKRAHSRPAVDALFASAAAEYAERVVAFVLTGRGYDGTEGLRAISSEGGLALVQKPADALAPSMPNHAISQGHVHGELGLDDIAMALVAVAYGQAIRVSRCREREG